MLKKIRHFIFKVVITLLVLTLVSVLVFRFVPIPVTPLMLIRCVEQKLDGKPMKLNKDWVGIEEISNTLQLAVVCSEDQNFLEHHGFDFGAIKKAMNFNGKHKRTKGASTISQQTAKNVFLWPGRSWVRKGLEVYFTFLIEVCWNKERIMEVYLNVIEMGNGVYGAEAAAQTYFHKPAEKLSNTQAALLAAVLPNPRKFSAAKPSAYTISRRQWVLQQMGFWGGELKYK